MSNPEPRGSARVPAERGVVLDNEAAGGTRRHGHVLGRGWSRECEEQKRNLKAAAKTSHREPSSLSEPRVRWRQRHHTPIGMEHEPDNE